MGYAVLFVLGMHEAYRIWLIAPGTGWGLDLEDSESASRRSRARGPKRRAWTSRSRRSGGPHELAAIRVRGGRESASFEYDRAGNIPSTSPSTRIDPVPTSRLRRSAIRHPTAGGEFCCAAPRSVGPWRGVRPEPSSSPTSCFDRTLRFSTAGDGPFLAEPGDTSAGRFAPAHVGFEKGAAPKREGRRSSLAHRPRFLMPGPRPRPGQPADWPSPSFQARRRPGHRAVRARPRTAGWRVPEWRMERCCRAAAPDPCGGSTGRETIATVPLRDEHARCPRQRSALLPRTG